MLSKRSTIHLVNMSCPVQRPMLTIFIATLSYFISSAVSWDLRAISLDGFASSCVARRIACIFSPLDTIDRSYNIWMRLKNYRSAISMFFSSLATVEEIVFVFNKAWRWFLLTLGYFVASSWVLGQSSLLALTETPIVLSFGKPS